ncbi:MAG TPA: AAA family ATPase [Mycobacteriales bacterium]|nr:AAA family ATPase [Mycobacteriales bacterium]
MTDEAVQAPAEPRRPAATAATVRTGIASVLVSDAAPGPAAPAPAGAPDLGRHETLFADAVSAHGGRVLGGPGTTVVAVFTAAADAVAAAVRLHRQLHGQLSRDGGEVIARAGISAGDVVETVEGCGGPAVDEAHRLAAAAPAGEILAADVVRALAGGALDQPLAPATPLPGYDGAADDPADLAGVPVWRVDWRPRSGGWAAMPVPPRLGGSHPGRFVGRSRELADLSDTIARTVDSGGRRLIVVRGESGVGKSALAAEAARRSHAAGGTTVLYGACDEEIRPPYQPFAQALRHLVRHAPTAALDGYVRRRGSDLAALVPELGDRLGRVPESRAGLDPAARHLLFAAIASLLDEVLAERPLLVVIDDLQWADRGTLLLLRHVLSSPDLRRLVLVATVRAGEPATAEAEPLLDRELNRLADVHRIDLAGLDYADVRELAATLLDAEHGSLESVSQTVHRESAGNAFFAIELLQHLRETAGAAEMSRPTLPVGVREVVRHRVGRLGPAAVAVLSCAAVLGAEFELDPLVQVATATEDAVHEVVQAAVAGAVLREVRDGTRFQFCHALVQRTLYDDLTETRRRRLHRAAAEALASRPPASAAAAHWVAAGDLAEPERVAVSCRAAGEEAMLAHAPDEAARWFTLARSALASDVDDAVLTELLLRLGEAQRLAGDANHRATFRAAAAAAQRRGDTDQLAAAALGSTRWFATSVGTADAEQIALIEAALAAVGPEPSRTRARLLATLTEELVYTDRTEERFALIDEALHIARHVGDPTTLFDVLFWRATVGRPALLTDRDMVELDELAALSTGLDPTRQVLGDLAVVMRGLEVGQLEAADGAMERASRQLEQLRLPVLRWLATVLRTTRATVRGELAEAEALLNAAWQLSQATDQPDALTWYGVQLYMIRFEQGRLGDLIDLLTGGLASAPRLYAWHGALTMSYVESGRFPDALRVVGEMLAHEFPEHPAEPHWLVGMVGLGTGLARLSDAGLVDSTAVQRAYCALEPYGGHWASILPLSLGSIDRVRGQLALALGRHDEAEQHCLAAIASNEGGPAPSFAARARYELIRVLLARDAPADRERVPALAADVRAAVERYHLTRVGELLDALPL